jgi:hypothetical protein
MRLAQRYLAGNREVMALEFFLRSDSDHPVGVGISQWSATACSVGYLAWGHSAEMVGSDLGCCNLIFYVLGAALGMATTGASLRPNDRRRADGYQRGMDRLGASRQRASEAITWRHSLSAQRLRHIGLIILAFLAVELLDGCAAKRPLVRCRPRWAS